MKKIDLHIHTISTISDDNSFVFDIEKLREYINKQEVSCVAITNHNIFDLQQYNEISDLMGCTVLPGIEINLLSGHLLLISDAKDLTDFKSRCDMVQEKIKDKKDCINISELKEIYVDLNKYLLIPHYDKKPKLNEKVINQLSEYISAGEVQSTKKFIYNSKNRNNLVPVLFSDSRLTKETNHLPIRQTYIDLREISFSGIKNCLNDKHKVALSERDGNSFFQALDSGLNLSTGLNVILGERSSGKSYTLDRIFESNLNVLYLRQFQLLETDEEESKKKFKDQLSTRNSNISETYLEEFRKVIEDVSSIDLSSNKKDIDDYLLSLKKNAEEHEIDVFSSASLFNASLYREKSTKSIKGLITSVENLLENTEFKELISIHIDEEKLRSLLIDLILKYRSIEEQNQKNRWINEIITNVKKGLQLRSASTSIKNIDFLTVLKEDKKIEKFKEIVEYVKEESEICRQEIQEFRLIAKTALFNGAGELNKKCGKRSASFTNAFQVYSEPYEYLQELKKINEIETSSYYQYFVNTDFQILNKYGTPVSGGERSEFNLLQAIADAQQYDMLLIDEPESSFDNLFLMNDVNVLIKDISKNLPVIVVTHNSTIGASIKPDFVLYTKKELNGRSMDYFIFSGYPTDKELVSLEGKRISNYNILLNCLEAGREAYTERGQSYEILEN